MSEPSKIVALLPMRAQSERVVGKNLKSFAGKPLYHHILQSLLTVDLISEVLIDTDSDEIAGEAPQMSDRVRVIPRPLHLRAGETPMNDVLLHDVSQVEADWVLQTHATNPLLLPETIERAIKQVTASKSHDSLFSVTPLQTRLWWPSGKAINHDPNVLLRTQDLDKVYEENSNLYIFRPDTLKVRKNRIGWRPILFEISREEAWDIDEDLDFSVAEFLMNQRKGSQVTS